MKRIAIFVSLITVSILVCATASLAANCPSGAPYGYTCTGYFAYSTGTARCYEGSRDVGGDVFKFGTKVHAIPTRYGNGGVMGCAFDKNKNPLVNSFTGVAYGYGDTASSGNIVGTYKYVGCKACWR